MLALNIYKNICRPKLRRFGCSISNLNSTYDAIFTRNSECKSLRIIEKPVLAQCRCFSNNSKTDPDSLLPPLSDTPIVCFPSFFKTINNFLYVSAGIKPSLDPEFDMHEFVAASKQALYVVSNNLAKENYDNLEGLVTDDVIHNLKQKISTFTSKQKQYLTVDPDDIYMSFPYEVTMESDDERDQERTLIQIMVVHHMLRGFKQMKESGETPSFTIGMLPAYKERIVICNYRFIREYMPDVHSPWIINLVNYYMPNIQTLEN